MNKQPSDKLSRNLLGFFPQILLVLLIGFNFYKGITVHEIGIPGFTIKFFPQGISSEPEYERNSGSRDNSGSISEVDPEQEISQSEVDRRQKQLEAELLDLRQQLEEREESEVAPSVANLTGTWQTADGSEVHIISQTGTVLVVQVVEPYTQTIFAVGQGTIDQKEINISYETIFGAAQGNLAISSNQQQITGVFEYPYSGQRISTILVKVG